MVITQPIDTDLTPENVKKDVRIFDTVWTLQAPSIGEVVSSFRAITVRDKFWTGNVFWSWIVRFTPYPSDTTKYLVRTLDMLTVQASWLPTYGTACSVWVIDITTGVHTQLQRLDGRRSTTTMDHFANSSAIRYQTVWNVVTMYRGANTNGYFSIYIYDVSTNVMTKTSSSQSSAPWTAPASGLSLWYRTIQVWSAYVSTAWFYDVNTNTAYWGMFTTIQAI